MDANDWSVLMRAAPFSAMGPDLTRMLAQVHSVRNYERGDQIFRQDDPAESLFVVIRGFVKLCREHEKGGQVVISTLAAGDVFFEPSMFVDGCYCASAETVSPARVMSLAASSLRQAILQQPRLAFDLFATSSSDIKRLVDQVDQVRTLSVTQRIADFFLRPTAATSGSATFALPYSKTLIASLVGTKPECFSRSLVELRQHGVKVTRDIVTVQDVGALAVFAGAPSNDDWDDKASLPTPFASLAKRRVFDGRLVKEWRKSVNSGAPLSLLLIDVGQDRRSGDSYAPNHDRGLLTAVSKVIALDGDQDGRFMVHYSDEVFAVAAPTTDHQGAATLGEKIRTAIETSAIRGGLQLAAPAVATAIGTATIIPTAHDRIEKIVCYADIALYRAKALGRNLVCSFHDDPSCETAKYSPSGGVLIPAIKSPLCAECRAGAPLA
jgi:diguanylate cyclase (GGDEF)-like protein